MEATDVRLASRADIETLVAWNLAMAQESEGRALDPVLLRRGVSGVFDEPARGFYLIAERAGAAVGALLITYEWSDWRAAEVWWLQSVYVSPAARRSGVFRSLYAAVRERAAKAGAAELRLYVEKENRQAQATYAGVGMRQSSYLMWESPVSGG